tara:strand:+ start:183 stop:398 length:216 start_codon:yes stop_codon:yes gene_type:complete
MSRKENDDFIATKAEKTFDDEGKTVDANVSSNYRGGLLYKGKAKDYPGITEILKKKKAKVIKIDIGKKKKD